LNVYSASHQTSFNLQHGGAYLVTIDNLLTPLLIIYTCIPAVSRRPTNIAHSEACILCIVECPDLQDTRHEFFIELVH